MRQHLRFLMFCCLAAVAAGCSNSDKDGNGGSNNTLAPAGALCGSIGDRVWLDENGNGIQDDGEPGVAGVTIEAEVCGGSLAATTTTDANGNYLFDNLDDAVSYRLCFFAPPGYAWTTPNQGGVEQSDSDVMADGCLNACVILNSCKAPRYVDAGLRRTETEGCGSIGDKVWLDSNCNGIQDGGEVGVAGVTVNLETCEGAFVKSTVTDASGNYLFDFLDDQVDYRVCFVLPGGYTFSPANQGGVEATDSDAGPNGCTDCISLNDCKAPRTVDAGLCQSGEPGCGSIGDRVWLDGNCDGIQNGGEVGVPGVTVNLETCEGAFVTSTVTDGNGNYLFDNLDDSIDYRVCFVLPAGHTFAPANQGGVEANDSDAGSDGCTDCISLDDCKAPRTVDAGLCREEDEAEGCTPGFWKNHLNHWAGTGYSPDDVFDDVFGCDLFGDDTTLGEAVNSQGTLKNLGFHGVAALLNAASSGVDYKYTVDEVKDIVCDAVTSGDLEGGKNLLADANESLCPLSGK